MPTYNKRYKQQMDDNKSKALAAALSQIEKQYGKGSIMKMDDAAIKDIEVVSPGSLGLDIALGVGGLPRGRVVEIYGPESSGKTTLALHVIAEAQKGGGTAAFVDAEHALDPVYAQKLSVKTDEPRAWGLMKASAWIETRRSALTACAFATRAFRARK